MAFSWTAVDDGPVTRERIPAGKHTVKIVNVIGEGRAGPFASSQGDRQIMVVMHDGQQREVTTMLTLSEKAAWKLKQLVQCCTPAFNLEAMEKSKVGLEHFADADFAKLQLGGRTVRVDITYEEGKNGREYAQVQFLRPPAGDPAPAVPDTDIPF